MLYATEIFVHLLLHGTHNDYRKAVLKLTELTMSCDLYI